MKEIVETILADKYGNKKLRIELAGIKYHLEHNGEAGDAIEMIKSLVSSLEV